MDQIIYCYGMDQLDMGGGGGGWGGAITKKNTRAKANKYVYKSMGTK